MDRPIIVGLDGSPESRAAAAWGGHEAVLRGLPLRLVHAWIVEPLDSSSSFGDRERAGRLLEETSEELISRHPGLEVTTELLAAVPSAVLPEQAEEAAMLVLGSRGHTALGGFLIGSVSLHVIAHARGPVVMVRTPGGEREDGEPRGEEEGEEREEEEAGRRTVPEVVVGVKELGEAGDPLLHFAFTAAAARGAPLRAVRAWGAPPLFWYSAPGGWPEGRREGGEETGIEAGEHHALSRVLGPWRERFPGVPVVEHLRFGNSSEVLLTAAAGAGLVVVGRHAHRPVMGPRIGPVVHAAVHHARSPVAIVSYR